MVFRFSFAVALASLALTTVSLVAATAVGGAAPLLWVLWPAWAVTALGAVVVHRMSLWAGAQEQAAHGNPEHVPRHRA